MNKPIEIVEQPKLVRVASRTGSAIEIALSDTPGRSWVALFQPVGDFGRHELHGAQLRVWPRSLDEDSIVATLDAVDKAIAKANTRLQQLQKKSQEEQAKREKAASTLAEWWQQKSKTPA